MLGCVFVGGGGGGKGLEVLFPKIVINHPWTYKKLHIGKGGQQLARFYATDTNKDNHPVIFMYFTIITNYIIIIKKESTTYLNLLSASSRIILSIELGSSR